MPKRAFTSSRLKVGGMRLCEHFAASSSYFHRDALIVHVYQCTPLSPSMMVSSASRCDPHVARLRMAAQPTLVRALFEDFDICEARRV